MSKLTTSALCYINVYKGIFKNQDFNFDNNFKFHIDIDKEEQRYTLFAEKTNSKKTPSDFFGKNISTVHAIVGKNGAGKTSFIDVIIDNINVATNTMDGTGIIYIMKQDDEYVCYSNCRNFVIDKSIKDLNIKIFTKSEWVENKCKKIIHKQFVNEQFFNSFVFFTNNFASSYKRRSPEFIIDHSLDKTVKEIIESEDFNSNMLNKLLLNKQYLDILDLLCSEEYEKLPKLDLCDLPNLLKFKFNKDQKKLDLHNEYWKPFFLNERCISKKRFSFLSNNQIPFRDRDNKLAYESAINLFAVCLMQLWVDDEIINFEQWKEFNSRLAETDIKNGIEIIADLVNENIINLSKTIFFYDILYLMKNNEKFISEYQDDKEFCIRWEVKDKKRVENILKYFGGSNRINEYYDCDFVIETNNGKGIYSSGEYYRNRIFAELYLAHKEIKLKSKNNKNILLLIDEIDLYLHPSLQTKIINDILKFIDSIFKKYNVQIIFTTNNPFTISDIPPANIIYLESGVVIEKEANTFGANINTLLKDSFYMNATIGEFSKHKINQVINYFNKNHDRISKEEVKYIISIVGEPIVRNKLEKMYYNQFPEDIVNQEEKMIIYKEKINDLESYIKSGKIVKKDDLDELTDRLNDLLGCLNNINS